MTRRLDGFLGSRNQEFEGPIDLMIADLIMPLMSGREMAEKPKETRSNLGVIFRSGLTSSIVDHQRLREPIGNRSLVAIYQSVKQPKAE